MKQKEECYGVALPGDTIVVSLPIYSNGLWSLGRTGSLPSFALLHSWILCGRSIRNHPRIAHQRIRSCR